MEVNSKKRALSSLNSLAKQIDFEPDYQRGVVWRVAQQRNAIDSIFRGFYIPEVILREINSDKHKYEVIDGKQRFTSFLKFLNNEIKLKGTVYKDYDLTNMKYEDLPPEAKEVIDDYNISIAFIKATDEEIREMFTRLQEGSPLNPQEKRNAKKSDVKDFANELVKHPLFEIVAFNNNRGAFAEEASKYIYLELTKGEEKISQAKINDLYIDYAEELPIEIKNKVESVLDFLGNSFQEKSALKDVTMLKKGTLHALYLLTSELRDIMGDELDMYTMPFKDWFEEFESMRKEERLLDEQKPVFAKYNELIVSGTTDSESLLGRKEILLDVWTEFLIQSTIEKNKDLGNNVREKTKNIFDAQTKLIEVVNLIRVA